MDVRLPDGTVIQGVPDGMSRADLTAKLARNGYDVSKLEAPSEPAKQPIPSGRELFKEANAGAMNYSGGGNALGGLMAGAGSFLPDSMKSRYEGAAKDVLGADPESTAYKTTKLLGQLGLTAGVGPALGVGAKAVGASAPVVNALTTSGMTTGAAPVGFGAKAADVALRMGAGATVGGASAAAAGDDPRMGAVIGGVTPGALQLVGGVAKGIGNAFSNKAAENTAVERVRGAIGQGTPGNLAQPGVIPLSAAARTQSPELARIEQASRLRNPETWYDFDQKQGKAAFDKVTQATDDATLLNNRLADRSANWNGLWGTTKQSADPKIFAVKIPEFSKNIDVALQSPESSNPAVRNMLEAVKAEIARTGDNFSPSHLQQIRANLNGKYNPMSPNAFASAPRDSKATRDVIREIDDILNTTTGGAWAKVPAAYKADSELVYQSKAASKVRNAFNDAETGRTLGVSLDPMGDIPKITEAGLGRAMNAARMPVTQKLALSQSAEQELSTVLDALRKQNIVQGVKRSASAGGGSDTASNVMALAPGGTTKSIINQLISTVKEAGNNKTNSRLAELLSDPDSLNVLLQTPAKQQNSVLKQLLYRSAPVAIAQ